MPENSIAGFLQKNNADNLLKKNTLLKVLNNILYYIIIIYQLKPIVLIGFMPVKPYIRAKSKKT